MRGQRFALDVLTSDTIADVKYKIEREKGYDQHTQLLTFFGKILRDDRTLEDYNMHHKQNLPLHLVFRLPGGI